MSCVFNVKGPFRVPARKLKGGRHIDQEEATKFWKAKKQDRWAKRYGCYVFGVKAGQGIRPWYVGQTTKRFDSECFQPHKLNKYNLAIDKAGFGTPVLFLVVAPKGKKNRKAVGQLESFLITEARTRNPGLLNKQGGKKKRRWGIQGVFGGSPGKKAEAAKEFAGMLRL